MWTANLRKESQMHLKAIKKLRGNGQNPANGANHQKDANRIKGGSFINSDLYGYPKRVLGIAIEQSRTSFNINKTEGPKGAIRTIMEKSAGCLRFTACLPQSWWEFCVNHASFLDSIEPPIARP